MKRTRQPGPRALLGLTIALSLLACRTAPIRNVVDSPVPGGFSLVEVGEAIQQAAARRGWSVEEAGPGRVLATLRLRGHRATVEIAYSARAFSITYRDSDNLRAGDGVIHRNYNSWVLKLEQTIRGELLQRARRPGAAAQ